jgi:hypothetical protein
MSAYHGTHFGVFLVTLVVLLALAALLAPRTVRAESLLLLFKGNSMQTMPWQETIRQHAKQPAIVGLNAHGDLNVKCGSMNVVMAYSPPEELHKQQEPVRYAMAVNQAAPSISGVSVRMNFSF